MALPWTVRDTTFRIFRVSHCKPTGVFATIQSPQQRVRSLMARANALTGDSFAEDECCTWQPRSRSPQPEEVRVQRSVRAAQVLGTVPFPFEHAEESGLAKHALPHITLQHRTG